MLLVLAPGPLLAMDVEIEASIAFKPVISATIGRDMDFGIIEFDAVHSGTIEMGTDGHAQIGLGSTGLTAQAGTSMAADITFSGDSLSVIEVACEANGVLSSASGALPLRNIEFSVDSGTSFGAGLPCAGLSSTSETIDLGLSNAPKLYFGGAVDVAPNAINGLSTYSTANAGGDLVTVRVIYQ